MTAIFSSEIKNNAEMAVNNSMREEIDLWIHAKLPALLEADDFRELGSKYVIDSLNDPPFEFGGPMRRSLLTP